MRFALILVLLLGCGDEPQRVSVGAAAVLRHAMPELTAAYSRTSGVTLDAVYGATDTLIARNPNVLVVADDTKLTAPTVVATTAIVLVGPADSKYRFANLTDGAVVAIGDPKTVPAGRYARDYLTKLGIWDAVSEHLVFGGDVVGVLAQTQRGTSHVGIVYATDAQDAAPLVVLDRPADGPVVHIVAAAHSKTAPAERFVQWLTTPPAQAILRRHGFAAP